MSRRGLCKRLGFTGTGFAHAITGTPRIAPIAGSTIEPNGSMCGDRVEREPAGVLGRAIAEPQRDDAVADLVQDHRDDEAAEEDERLLDVGAHSARAVGAAQRRCDAQVMQSRASGIASSRASLICC